MGESEAKCQDLSSTIWSYIEENRFEDAESEMKNADNIEYVMNNCMEIIPLLIIKLKESENIHDEECIENLLIYISKTAQVKEVVIVLLEEFRSFKSYAHFRVMIRALQAALERQISTSCNPTLFIWTFKSVCNEVFRMDLPSAYSLEGDERMLLDMDPCVILFNDVLRCLLCFFEFFYKSIVTNELVFVGNINSKKCICWILLRLFDRPLMYLDIFSQMKADENGIYRSTRKLVAIIADGNKNVMNLVFKAFSSESVKVKKEISSHEDVNGDVPNDSECEDEEDDSNFVSQDSLATLLYCILHEEMSLIAMPCIYNSLFRWLQCLPLVCKLLLHHEQLPLHKGLLLGKILVCSINDNGIPLSFLESPFHYAFIKHLVRIMTQVDNKELRAKSLALYRQYLNKLTCDARFRIFESIILTATHAGIIGFTITEIKQNIAIELNKTECTIEKLHDVVSDTAFTGRSMWSLIELSCSLPDGERTDLLEWSEKILAMLNLLTFIFLRAQVMLNKYITSTKTKPESSNSLGQKDILLTMPNFISLSMKIKMFQEKLFTPLHRGLQLSREHYELKLKDIRTTNEKKDVLGQKAEVIVNIDNSLLPGMSLQQQEDLVSLALSRFDLIACVLTRTESAALEFLHNIS